MWARRDEQAAPRAVPNWLSWKLLARSCAPESLTTNYRDALRRAAQWAATSGLDRVKPNCGPDSTYRGTPISGRMPFECGSGKPCVVCWEAVLMQQVFVHHCDSVLSQQRSKATPSITLPSEAVASCPAAPTPLSCRLSLRASCGPVRFLGHHLVMQCSFSTRPVAWARMSRAGQMAQRPQAALRATGGNGSMSSTDGGRAVASAPPGEHLRVQVAACAAASRRPPPFLPASLCCLHARAPRSVPVWC